MATNNMYDVKIFNDKYDKYNKSIKPIQCRPYYVPAKLRIAELAQAISQNVDEMVKNRLLIKKWGEEIVELCCMVDYLTDDDEKE